MNNFTMKLSALPEILDPELVDFNTRYAETKYGKFKETKSKNTCCICKLNFWVQGSAFIEGFKVIDPRAYEDGITPDYLKISNVLKEVHYSCKDELNKQLNDNTFVV
jgi:hypothetical protein